MEVRNVGGVLIAAGAACLLFFGVSFVYWASDLGRIMTKVLLLTAVVSLGGGALLFGVGQTSHMRRRTGRGRN